MWIKFELQNCGDSSMDTRGKEIVLPLIVPLPDGWGQNPKVN